MQWCNPLTRWIFSRTSLQYRKYHPRVSTKTLVDLACRSGRVELVKEISELAPYLTPGLLKHAVRSGNIDTARTVFIMLRDTVPSHRTLITMLNWAAYLGYESIYTFVVKTFCRSAQVPTEYIIIASVSARLFTPPLWVAPQGALHTRSRRDLWVDGI